MYLALCLWCSLSHSLSWGVSKSAGVRRVLSDPGPPKDDETSSDNVTSIAGGRSPPELRQGGIHLARRQCKLWTRQVQQLSYCFSRHLLRIYRDGLDVLRCASSSSDPWLPSLLSSPQAWAL